MFTKYAARQILAWSAGAFRPIGSEILEPATLIDGEVAPVDDGSVPEGGGNYVF